jgi:hypothetical protein
MDDAQQKRLSAMIRVEIQTENDAFKENFENEVQAVFLRIVSRLVNNLPLENGDKFKVVDSNGNSVGFVEWIED